MKNPDIKKTKDGMVYSVKGMKRSEIEMEKILKALLYNKNSFKRV
jgi:hypothetical protein